MPNHVVNELVFNNVNTENQERILSKSVNNEGLIDFEILLPTPINCWMHNESSRHKEAFKNCAMDWARDNWGTKWNAYGQGDEEKYVGVVKSDDALTLTFQTAWRPPYGWIVALFNTLGISFGHNWLSEGGEPAHSDEFIAQDVEKMCGGPWREHEADEAMQKHLHMLLWGCESFDDEDE